jgi:hypothetical protein
MPLHALAHLHPQMYVFKHLYELDNVGMIKHLRNGTFSPHIAYSEHCFPLPFLRYCNASIDFSCLLFLALLVETSQTPSKLDRLHQLSELLHPTGVSRKGHPEEAW